MRFLHVLNVQNLEPDTNPSQSIRCTVTMGRTKRPAIRFRQSKKAPSYFARDNLSEETELEGWFCEWINPIYGLFVPFMLFCEH